MHKNRNKRLNVLFLCTGNSCRSQMAEGRASALKKNELKAYSAGIEKHGLNPFAIRVMAEKGVDISGQQVKIVEELPIVKFDYIITLCEHAHETCPYFPGEIIHHGFDDPPRLAADADTEEEKLNHYRRVRDEIGKFVEMMPQSLFSAVDNNKIEKICNISTAVNPAK